MKSLCMDPATHSIINSVFKHGINPPTVPNLNEAFIEILGLVSDFAVKVSGDVGSVGEASTRAGLNAKSQRREPAVAQKSTPHQSPQGNKPQYPTPAQMAWAKCVPHYQVVLSGHRAKS